MYAVVTYPTHLKGGTAKYTGATGDFNSLGEADLVNGQIRVRYSGKICFAGGDSKGVTGTGGISAFRIVPIAQATSRSPAHTRRVV